MLITSNEQKIHLTDLYCRLALVIASTRILLNSKETRLLLRNDCNMGREERAVREN